MYFDQNKILHEKIIAGSGTITGKTILHTAPHHDDILLSYHAYLMKLLPHNSNHVAYITSGSNGVFDAFVERRLHEIDRYLVEQSEKSSYSQSLKQFALACAQQNLEQINLYKKLIFIHIIAEIFDCMDNDELMKQVIVLQTYFKSKKIGDIDIPLVIQFKGRIRESEAETKWMISKGDCKNVTHLRSTFYHANSRRADAAMEYDIQQCILYLEQIQPNIITIALDPSGVGPRTHYRSLQLISTAISRCPQFKDVQIIGYRNVWSSFELDQSSIIVPVTESEIVAMESIFDYCYETQKNTIFAGTDSDGNFAAQVRYIQEVQWQQVQNKLGSNYTLNNQLDTTLKFVGAIFLQSMTIDALVSIACDER